MLTDTKISISVDNIRFDASRGDFISNVEMSEEKLDKSLEDSSVLGRDLLMIGEGDLFLREREFFSARDIRDLGGLLNYAQAISHRLMTPRGYHPEDRFFGVPWYNYIGKTYSSSSAIRSQIVSDVTEEVYKDRRTREVHGVSANFLSPTVLEVTCSVVPVRVNISSLTIELAIEGRE